MRDIVIPVLNDPSWLSWTGGRFIKHLYRTTTNQIWYFLAGF